MCSGGLGFALQVVQVIGFGSIVCSNNEHISTV